MYVAAFLRTVLSGSKMSNSYNENLRKLIKDKYPLVESWWMFNINTWIYLFVLIGISISGFIIASHYIDKAGLPLGWQCPFGITLFVFGMFGTLGYLIYNLFKDGFIESIHIYSDFEELLTESRWHSTNHFLMSAWLANIFEIRKQNRIAKNKARVDQEIQIFAEFYEENKPLEEKLKDIQRENQELMRLLKESKEKGN